MVMVLLLPDSSNGSSGSQWAASGWTSRVAGSAGWSRSGRQHSSKPLLRDKLSCSSSSRSSLLLQVLLQQGV